MELKHNIFILFNFLFCPLIVPYGIETLACFFGKSWGSRPLIVPYGIETRKPHLLFLYLYRPLIVPYGIETKHKKEQRIRLLFL
ncbi:MAG: hypothetical protein H6Q13_1346 [Bacteroidetes bacterium]|nr:hypothetical protein [Bacteroidota bacterium]